MYFPSVLVLGATGRIGGILRRCWPAGRALWQSRTDRAGRAGAREKAGPDWITLDPLADPAGLARAAQGCDAVLCLAGVTNAAAAEGADMDDNITLALAAIRAAAEAGAEGGARVLLASSAAVYGNQSGVLDEATPLAPLSDYGRAKAEMEDQGLALAQKLGISATALRIGNIAGVDAILGNWRPGFALDRFADGTTPRRSYIGPATLARVLGDLAATPDLPPVLNVATPGMIEMGALLDAAGLAWTPRPAPQTAIPRVCLSTAALEAVTSFASQAATPAAMVAEWRRLGSIGTGSEVT